jgi:RNA polymerase sigma-70 factor (ECF subfamily)
VQSVRAALATLPERQREALVLCHFQGMTNIEAAALLELSVDALESLLARARRGMREAMMGART